MVSPIQFPSPVMRIDPETRALVVVRRDPDTGVIAAQAPTEATLQMDRDERAAAERAAQVAQAAPTVRPPAVAAAAASSAAPAPSAPVAASPVATAPVSGAAAHLSVFV